MVCKNCGNGFTGKFCNNCGEKVYEENSKSFAHLAEEVFHFFTHLDNKFLKTLKVLFTKPGQVSLEFCNGIRKRYFRPVSLFLVGIIIYLLVPVSPGLNLSLPANLANTSALGLQFPQAMVDRKMEKQAVSFEALSEKYKQKSVIIAKPMLFIILPLIGLTLMLFFNRRKKFYFDHFILGVEISNFFLYFAFIILAILMSVVAKLIWWAFDKNILYDDYVTGPTVLTALLVNWVIAFKRFYGVKTVQAIIKAFLFLFPFAIIVFFIYRLLLFLTTLLFI